MKECQVNKLLIGGGAILPKSHQFSDSLGGHLDQLNKDRTLFIVPYKRIGLLGFYSFSVERGTIK